MKYSIFVLALSFLFSCGEKPKNLALGSKVYKAQCVLCHGNDGKLGLNNSKDLTKSTLSLEEKTGIIRKGKNAMLAYDAFLSNEEIEAVANYVHSLKSN